jgi:hypothetical protein
VLERREPARLLPRLWAPTLLANVAGMLILALIFSSSMVLDHRAVVAAGHTPPTCSRIEVPAPRFSARSPPAW